MFWVATHYNIYSILNKYTQPPSFRTSGSSLLPESMFVILDPGFCYLFVFYKVSLNLTIGCSCLLFSPHYELLLFLCCSVVCCSLYFLSTWAMLVFSLLKKWQIIRRHYCWLFMLMNIKFAFEVGELAL